MLKTKVPARVKEILFERDGRICQSCGRELGKDKDIMFVDEDGKVENMYLVCKKCGKELAD